MKSLKEKIEVMQAVLDGKEAESRPEDREEWHPASSPQFAWMDFDYRIKPEPMEFLVNIYENIKGETFTNYEDAKNQPFSFQKIKTIKVREVIE